MKQFILGIFNGFAEIWSHKLRSLLTIICVVMGVASLVLITGFINGLFGDFKSYLAETGMNQKVVVARAAPPKWQQHLAAISPGRTLADVDAIRAQARYARYVNPTITLDVEIRRKKKVSDSELVGATEAVLPLNHVSVERGRFFGDLDMRQAEPVIVLGATAAEDLYEPNERVLGTQVFLDGQAFTVIGVLKKYELMRGTYNVLEEKNYLSYVPLTSAQRRITHQDEISQLEIQVTDTDHVGELSDELENILLQTHRGIHDFRIRSYAQYAQRENQVENGFVAGGGAIGLVTLIVGGIGIMNLMLASINERIREIGIRKALGAWGRDIFVQFVAEAVTLATLGGALGVGAGVGAVRVIQKLLEGNKLDFPIPQVSTAAIMVGFAFSVVLGIGAGLYPAFRASLLDPIEALRYE